MAQLWSQFSLLSSKQSSAMAMHIIRVNNWSEKQKYCYNYYKKYQVNTLQCKICRQYYCKKTNVRNVV